MPPAVFLRALPRLAVSSRLSLVAAASLPRVTINAPTFARTLAAAATKKATGSAKAKAAPKKAAAAKKTAATKKKAPASKKPAAKKAAAKKKPAAKKTAGKTGRPRKPLTEEEKKERLFLRKVKEYKEAALPRAPSGQRLSTLNVFLQLQTKASSTPVPFADIAARYKGLTIQETQGLAKDQEKINAERAETYRKWVEQYTPQEVEKANNARRWLKKNNVKRVDVTPIKDHRRVTGPRSAYIFFATEQQKNQNGQNVSDVAREAGRKWKTLSAADKAAYEQLAKSDKERYFKERAQAGFV